MIPSKCYFALTLVSAVAPLLYGCQNTAPGNQLIPSAPTSQQGRGIWNHDEKMACVGAFMANNQATSQQAYQFCDCAGQYIEKGMTIEESRKVCAKSLFGIDM